MRLRVSDPGTFASSAQQEHQPVSNERAATIVLGLTKAADGVFCASLRLLIIGDDIQECPLARRAGFLSSTHEVESSGEPVAGLLARQLARRAEGATFGFALSLPSAHVITEFLELGPRLWHCARGLMPIGETRRQEQEDDGDETVFHRMHLLRRMC